MHSNLYEFNGFLPTICDEKNSWIAPTAVIIGKVKLETKSSIWFGAVLRGDNELIHIGAGSNIQENSILHTDMGFPLVIGQDCTIGHGAIIHGCKIGNNCLIGMGAIIMNGVTIGDNCLIGAGSLITEDTVISDGQLVVGRPAKVVKNLNEEIVGKLKKSAMSYQEKMLQFKSNLRVI